MSFYGYRAWGAAPVWNYYMDESRSYRLERAAEVLLDMRTATEFSRVDLLPIGVRAAPQWEPGENQAMCVSHGGTVSPFCSRGYYFMGEPPLVPYRDCKCGFWSYFYLPDAIQYARGMDFPIAFVTGVVENYGRIVVHDRGMRSQFSQVRALCVAPVSGRTRHPRVDAYLDRVREILQKQWDVPVFTTYQDMFREFEVAVPEPMQDVVGPSEYVFTRESMSDDLQVTKRGNEGRIKWIME